MYGLYIIYIYYIPYNILYIHHLWEDQEYFWRLRIRSPFFGNVNLYIGSLPVHRSPGWRPGGSRTSLGCPTSSRRTTSISTRQKVNWNLKLDSKLSALWYFLFSRTRKSTCIPYKVPNNYWFKMTWNNQAWNLGHNRHSHIHIFIHLSLYMYLAGIFLNCH